MNLFSLRRNPPSLDDLAVDASLPSKDDNLSSECLMPSVERPKQIFVRGQGSWLWDSDDRAYLDFSQGGGANSLGHSPSVLVNAIAAQAQSLINPGFGLHNRGMLNLAERLCSSTGSDQAYLLNSGSEACEAAIKLARKWGQRHRGGASRIIVANNGCHGRSLGTLSASDSSNLTNRFEPLLPGFSHVPFNDLAALHAAVDARTVAVMLEPIQSEAGVIPATEHYLKGVERLCRELGILLIFDEVQTGMGRSGKLFAYQHYGVTPDILSSAKSLGGGFPIGAMLTTEALAKHLVVGTHGTTYGGNPLACAVAEAVIDVINTPQVLAGVKAKQQRFKTTLEQFGEQYGVFSQVRGLGLLIGAVLSDAWKGKAKAILDAAAAQGVMVLQAGPDVVRFAPSLVVEDADIDEGLARFERALVQLTQA